MSDLISVKRNCFTYLFCNLLILKGRLRLTQERNLYDNAPVKKKGARIMRTQTIDAIELEAVRIAQANYEAGAITRAELIRFIQEIKLARTTYPA
jgi:hypothetical protein